MESRQLMLDFGEYCCRDPNPIQTTPPFEADAIKKYLQSEQKNIEHRYIDVLRLVLLGGRPGELMGERFFNDLYPFCSSNHKFTSRGMYREFVCNSYKLFEVMNVWTPRMILLTAVGSYVCSCIVPEMFPGQNKMYLKLSDALIYLDNVSKAVKSQSESMATFLEQFNPTLTVNELLYSLELLKVDAFFKLEKPDLKLTAPMGLEMIRLLPERPEGYVHACITRGKSSVQDKAKNYRDGIKAADAMEHQ